MPVIRRLPIVSAMHKQASQEYNQRKKRHGAFWEYPSSRYR